MLLIPMPAPMAGMAPPPIPPIPPMPIGAGPPMLGPPKGLMGAAGAPPMPMPPIPPPMGMPPIPIPMPPAPMGRGAAPIPPIAGPPKGFRGAGEVIPKGSLFAAAGIENEAEDAFMPPPDVLICELREGPELTVLVRCADAAGAFRSRFTREDHGSAEAEAAAWFAGAGEEPICLLLSWSITDTGCGGGATYSRPAKSPMMSTAEFLFAAAGAGAAGTPKGSKLAAFGAGVLVAKGSAAAAAGAALGPKGSKLLAAGLLLGAGAAKASKVEAETGCAGLLKASKVEAEAAGLAGLLNASKAGAELVCWAGGANASKEAEEGAAALAGAEPEKGSKAFAGADEPLEKGSKLVEDGAGAGDAAGLRAGASSALRWGTEDEEEEEKADSLGSSVRLVPKLAGLRMKSSNRTQSMEKT